MNNEEIMTGFACFFFKYWGLSPNIGKSGQTYQKTYHKRVHACAIWALQIKSINLIAFSAQIATVAQIYPGLAQASRELLACICRILLVKSV